MTALDLAIIGLSAHRLWVLWFKSKFTARLLVWMQTRGGWTGYFASCQLCVSVWAGFTATALWYSGPGHLLNIGLAAGGLVFLVQGIIALLEAVIEKKQAELAHMAHARNSHTPVHHG